MRLTMTPTASDARFQETDSTNGLQGTYVSLDGTKAVQLSTLINNGSSATGYATSYGLKAPAFGRYFAAGPNPALGPALGLTQGYASDTPAKIFWLLGVQRSGIFPGISAIKLGDPETEQVHELYRRSIF